MNYTFTEDKFNTDKYCMIIQFDYCDDIVMLCKVLLIDDIVTLTTDVVFV